MGQQGLFFLSLWFFGTYETEKDLKFSIGETNIQRENIVTLQLR